MILPRWLESRTEPVAIDDVVTAVVRALDIEISGSEWFDVPGPEILSGREILERTADALGVGTTGLHDPGSVPLSGAFITLGAIRHES
jgi:uncharacterized protein YbjT (DUF2867 family)